MHRRPVAKIRKMKTKMIDPQTMRESPNLKVSAMNLIMNLIKSIVMNSVPFVIQMKCYVANV